MMKLSAALGALGLAMLLLSAVPWPAPATQAPAPAMPIAAVTGDPAYGKALFSAKGCVSCHFIAGIPGSGTFKGAAPDLTHYRPNPDFLRQWLRAPSAVRPGTQMPTLGLSESEIESLIAFLSANAGP